MADPSGLSPEFQARYRLGRKLGEGGNGVVHEALQVSLERPVALKLLHSLGEEDVARFRREAAVLASLSHPHIVKVLDFGVDGRIPFLAMELLSGRTVQDALDAGPVAPPDALAIVAQLAEVLAFLHARGVVHRDVKPANAFLEKGGVVLTDFGLARALASGATITASGQIVGTPHYLAPEQVQGQPAGPAADQYALGVMAYQLFSRTMPFPDGPALQVAAARLERPPAPLAERAPGLPAPVVEVVMRMLARDPRERFADLEEVAARLRAATPGLRPAPRPRSMPDRPTLRASRPTPRLDGATLAVPLAAPGERATVVALLVAVLAVAALAAALLLIPGPIARLERSEWSGHRAVTLYLHGHPPAGARVLASVAGEVIASAPVDVGAAPVHLQLLPPSSDVMFRLVTAGGAPIGEPLLARTPTLVRLSALTVQPCEDGVLVAFVQPGHDELTTSIWRAGSPATPVGSPQTSRARAVRHVFEQLKPETDYEVRILSSSGWGGCAGLPFRTLDLEANHRRAQVEASIRSSELDFVQMTFGLHLDYRVLPAVRRSLDLSGGRIVAVRQMLWCARDFRSPELLDTLLPHLPDDDEDLSYAAQAAAVSGNPRAVELARRTIEHTTGKDVLRRALHALQYAGSSADADWLARQVDRLGHAAAEVAATLVALDPASAPEHFREWSEPGASPARARVALHGLALTGGADAVERLAGFARETPHRRLAALALFREGSWEALARLAAIWSTERAARRDLALPAALARVPGIGAGLAELAGPTSDVTGRREALQALGIAAPPEADGAIATALADRAPLVAEAAAWAAGRIGHAGPVAAERLARLAAGPHDGSGIAAWALAQCGRREALPALNQQLSRALASGTAADEQRLGALAWAVARLDPAGAAALAVRLHAHRGAATELAVACAQHAADVPAPDHFAMLMFPRGAPFDRTGVALEAGDVVLIGLEIRWGFDGPAPPASPGLQLEVRTRGPVRFAATQSGEAPVWERGELAVSPYDELDLPDAEAPLPSGVGAALLVVDRRR